MVKMMFRNKNRIFAIVLTLLLFTQALPTLTVYAMIPTTTDDFIFSDPVLNTFSGSREGAVLAGNLQFVDLPGDAAAQNAIIRSSVFNFFKGTGPQFRPNAYMSIQEALAFALRAAGYETAAVAAAAAELGTLPLGATAADSIYLGYLAMARNLGLITAAQFGEAFAPPVAEGLGLPDGIELETFRREDPATREQFAHWLVMAINTTNAAAFTPTEPHTQQQSIFTFADWESITPERLQSVEQIARMSVMTGTNNLFRPHGYVTRMEAAWAGQALDSIFMNIAGLERMYGTVAAIVDGTGLAAHYANLERNILVRRDDGRVDVLRFGTQVGGSPQIGTSDAVVLKHGAVGGLGTLDVSDPIEYIVDTATGTILFAEVRGAHYSRWARGRLQTINAENGTATFIDEYGASITHAMAQGLFREGSAGIEIRLGTRWEPLASMPFGAFFNVELMNNLIIELHFEGNVVIQPETWGVVIENNPFLGFLTILNADGQEMTFTYLSGSLSVQMIEHWDMRDTIGGIHALFPDMRFNPRITTIDAIQTGHIVSFRTFPDDPWMIESINASTNFTSFYGVVLDVNTVGPVDTILFQFENGVTQFFTLPAGVPVRRNGVMISAGPNPSVINAGEWARLLINQAFVAPGVVMNAVVSVDLEGDARAVTGFVTGQMSDIDRLQNRMVLQNVSRTTPGAPFSPFNFNTVEQFSMTHPQASYFLLDTGASITTGFINEFLRRGKADVFMALETAHGGERIAMATFTNPPRTEHLAPDTVVGVDGQGGFHLMSHEGVIRTNDSTIVVRNGRLVSGRHIMPWDHVYVTLAGENMAAIVNVSQAPNFSGVQIVRGRVQSVDHGQSFQVQSMALFDGQQWHFTPIERLFNIDNATTFMIGDTMMDLRNFVNFTPEAGMDGAENVFDRVFNIVVDGSRAARVTDAPYATQSIRGVIYHIEGDTIYLRETHVRDQLTGRWTLISNVSATSNVTTLSNSIIVDRDQVIGVNGLRVGQQIRVMTTTLPQAVPGMSVNGYIVLVER